MAVTRGDEKMGLTTHVQHRWKVSVKLYVRQWKGQTNYLVYVLLI